MKRVPPGTRVGYEGAYVTKEESATATLPVGYAYGLSRALSNCGEVLIRGRRLPVVREVCTDYRMVDAASSISR